MIYFFIFSIYKLQETGNAFVTVEELFAAADPKFLAYFNISAKEGFRNHVYLNEKTVDDLVRATIRVNYGQTTDVHLFLSTSDFYLYSSFSLATSSYMVNLFYYRLSIGGWYVR